jgi:hypothetical protein
MSQIAAHPTGSTRVSVKAAPGTTWFGLMVAVWSTFVTLLAVSQVTLEDVWNWLNGLSLVPEILMWILLLPWAVSYAVWQSALDHWLRVTIIVLFTGAHLALSAPRTKRR